MAPRTDGKVIEIRSRVIDRKLNKGGRKYFSTFSKFLHKYFARCYLSTIIGGIIVFFLLSVNRIRVRSIRKAGGRIIFTDFPIVRQRRSYGCRIVFRKREGFD